MPLDIRERTEAIEFRLECEVGWSKGSWMRISRLAAYL